MKIKLSYILCSLFLAILLISCINRSNKTTNNGNVLNIGVMSSMDYLPLAVAEANGLFEKEDVNITIHKFYSANERDAAFQSGNLDGTIIDYTGAAIQRAGGVELKIVSECNGTFMLITGKDSGINNIEDLKGKRIAVSSNTVIDFCTDLALQSANITLDDVQRMEINKIPLRLEMLRNGKIDATMLPDPFATIAMQDGNKRIIDIQDMDVNITGIAFHEKVIEQKKEALKKFYLAYNQAVTLLNSEPPSNFYSLLVSEIGFPADLVTKTTLPFYSEAQIPNESDLKKVAQWLKTKDLVRDNFDITTLIATGLIP